MSSKLRPYLKSPWLVDSKSHFSFIFKEYIIKSFFWKILHKITIFVWKNVFLKHVFTKEGQVGSKKFQCKMSLKLKNLLK